MKRIPVSRLTDNAVIREMKENIAQDDPHTARQVALIGEVERRRCMRRPDISPCSPTASASCTCPRTPRTSGSRSQGQRGSVPASLRPWLWAGQPVVNTESEPAPGQVGDPVTPSHIESPRPP